MPPADSSTPSKPQTAPGSPPPPLIPRVRAETSRLLTLALPICGAQLAQAGMSAVDVLMTGRSSATDLAAVSVGSSLWVPLLLLMAGTLMGLTPVVAQLMGGNRSGEVRGNVHQSLWISLVLGSLSGLALWYLAAPIFTLMEVPEAVAEQATLYLMAIAWGMPGAAFYQVLRAYSDGMNHTRPALIISLIGLISNIPLNYVLIYGSAGVDDLLGITLPGLLGDIPAMGAAGCGIATGLAMWIMCLSMFAYTRYSSAYRAVALWCQPSAPHFKQMGELLKVGLPIGIAIFFEVTLFTVIALFVASFGEIKVAAHQVALNFTSLLFMLPLSMAMALTVRVGHTIGRGDMREARFVAWNGVAFSLVVALVNDIVIWVLAEPAVALYTSNLKVQALAMSLITLAMLYQVSDSLQVAMAGALRGFKDTRIIMLITMFAYWVVGLGGGHLLGVGSEAFPISPWSIEQMGVYGYWIGMVAGLTVAALLLGWRLWIIARRGVRDEAMASQ
ncbi:multidrug resistance protein PmpM [Cobetia sp. AM6]|nr:multidrug resistance protein PmpM [Cobetia sp. AM6]